MQTDGTFVRHIAAITALAALLATIGCDQILDKPTAQAPAPAPIAKSPHRRMAHRFVLTKYTGDVAFDTQTGQICRTWDWVQTGPLARDAKGVRLQWSFGELAPTCIVLYNGYQSGTYTEADIAVEAAPEAQ